MCYSYTIGNLRDAYFLPQYDSIAKNDIAEDKNVQCTAFIVWIQTKEDETEEGSNPVVYQESYENSCVDHIQYMYQ